MKLNLQKLASIDPKALLGRIAELRKLTDLHRHAVTEPQKTDINDLPFSSMNALLKYSEQVMQGVVAVKDLVARLREIVNSGQSS